MIPNNFISLVFCVTFLLTYSLNWYLTDNNYTITLSKPIILFFSSCIYGVFGVYFLYIITKLNEELQRKKHEINQKINDIHTTLLNRPLLSKKVD